jgi:predicted ATP-grasp superfamily ATP-dependent carboligase
MEYVDMAEVPDLENALLIGAFAGWNDAASAATWAIKFLINQWEATPFAEIEPENFFDFSETRPRIRITNGAIRRLSWPANRFYVHKANRSDPNSQERDIVLFLGEEPQQRWKTFSQAMLDVCRQCQVEEMVFLGALIGEVPHTAPVQVVGTASEAAILRRMDRNSIERANYEGVTGVLTVLQDAARREDFRTVSLWGTAPHYVSATPNLPVSEALLEKLDALYHFDLRLHDLARAAQRFTARVTSLVAEDPEVAAYVQELEQRTPNDPNTPPSLPAVSDASGIHRIPMDGGLPSAEQAIQDVEEWLRRFRNDGERDS